MFLRKLSVKQSVPQKCCLCHCIFNGMNHRMRGRAHHRAHCLSRRSTKIAIAPPGTPGDFGRSLRSPKIARSAAGFWRINSFPSHLCTNKNNKQNTLVNQYHCMNIFEYTNLSIYNIQYLKKKKLTCLQILAWFQIMMVMSWQWPLTLERPDKTCNSPHYQPYNSYHVS